MLIGALALALAVGLVVGARAETIVPTSGSLFGDHSAHRVGDVVTILIVESTQAAKSTVTKTQTETENDASSLGRLDFIDFWNLDARNTSLGEGSTARRGDLQARLTARVTAVDPNGLLKLEGTRRVLVNGEEEEIKLVGTVRPRDIQPDNTVLSTYLADAAIEYTGEGVLASAEKPGVITRLMNWLF
jgi:flagellar L-ring protein precursor FlgH